MALSLKTNESSADCEFYQSTICHICKKISPNLKRCSGCKLFSYCSVIHQKEHWKTHKELCKMIEKMLKYSTKNKHHIFDLPEIDKLNYEEWKILQKSMKNIWENNLKRKLTSVEDQIWMFPRICEVCRTSLQDKLEDCAICYSASYCSTEHKQKHAYIHDKFCKELKLCYEINERLYNGLEYPKINILNTINKFPNTITEFIKKYVTSTQKDEYFNILSSEIISPILTILFSIISYSDSIILKQNITIHLIGASKYEESFDWLIFCDIITKFTSIKDLTVVLIGPEVSEAEITKQYKDTRIYLHGKTSFYHDFINPSLYNIPDVICAFNCGLHEFQNTINDTWIETIENIFNIQFKLFILTSYTENEACMDFKRLLPFVGDKMEVVLNCQKNNFASLRPIRDWETENNPIFYNNNFISVVKYCNL